MPPRRQKPDRRYPKIEWRTRKSASVEQPVLGRTYTLREPPKSQLPLEEIIVRRPRRSLIDWRGLGILVTTRDFVDRAIGITGELFVTAGLFVLLFLGWHVWFNDIIQGTAQDKASVVLSDAWQAAPRTLPEFDRAMGNSTGAVITVEPPIIPKVGDAKPFATIMIPRFGLRYERTIAETVDVATVLNNTATGVGHYSASNLLGEVGNFAIAGHRTTYGAAFGWVDTLRVGDRIYIETEEGWYVYRFRNMEWVFSSDVSVLNPVPNLLVEAKDRILTMTTCHPKLSSAERFISFSVFESFVPRANGAPAEVARMKISH